MREHRPEQGERSAAPAPLDLPYGEVKAEMGASFGADFSNVSIAHDGAAEAMGAQAFAQADSIHLAGGKGDPASQEGRALLGHEFAHVVQQREGRVSAPQGKDGPVVADQGLEEEADVAGAAAARGEAVPVSARASSATGMGRGGAQAKLEGAPIQMFGTKEHKKAGDEGSAGLTTDYHWKTQEEKDSGKGVGTGKFQFALTHGDIVTLSGDFFDPRDNDEKGKPIADSLFRCASTASTDIGKKPRTQDEILYALKTHNGGDPRFQKGGMWADIEFGEDVIKAVDSRYLKLAAKNDEHFQHPKGPGSGGPGSGNRASGGGSYRELHEDACLRAHHAKADGKPVTDAMAHEAAAQHFLTDAFAAGHARTPRGSIRSHWQSKYPLFFENLKKAIAHETAIWINANTTNGATILGSVQDITANILGQVEAATADLPAFGFDDVVSLVVHDIDNERGLWVTNELGDEWLTYGDGSMGKGDTAKHCKQAVTLGCQDIKSAYDVDPALDDDAALAEVRAKSPAPAKPSDKYAPEQAIPSLDPKKAADNGKQNWQADSFEALWKLPVRTDDPKETFETVITESMKSGELNHKLGGMANQFPEKTAVKGGWLGSVTPRDGYLKGFFEPIVKDPYSGMRRIIHYNPARGQSYNNTDDAVMEDFDRMDEKDKKAKKAPHESMKGLTLEQRISRTKELLSGYTAGDEGERIVQMFETTHDRAEARALYKGIEGHAWSGDWVQGWTVTDDDLWDDLSSSQLDRIKAVLNK